MSKKISKVDKLRELMKHGFSKEMATIMIVKDEMNNLGTGHEANKYVDVLAKMNKEYESKAKEMTEGAIEMHQKGGEVKKKETAMEWHDRKITEDKVTSDETINKYLQYKKALLTKNPSADTMRKQSTHGSNDVEVDGNGDRIYLNKPAGETETKRYNVEEGMKSNYNRMRAEGYTETADGNDAWLDWTAEKLQEKMDETLKLAGINEAQVEAYIKKNNIQLYQKGGKLEVKTTKTGRASGEKSKGKQVLKKRKLVNGKWVDVPGAKPKTAREEISKMPKYKLVKKDTTPKKKK
jgi:hypothetical protein